MIVSARTDVGKVRENNEDSYRMRIINDKIAYGIVCDGMGGASGGKIASQTACDRIAKTIDAYFEENKPPYEITFLMRKAIRGANEELYQMSRNDPELAGMGTTLVLAIVVKNDVFVANVGDSRAYLFYDNIVQQISVDHSAVQELVDSGKISPEEARMHPNKNIITRALGVDSMVDFDHYTYNIFAHDRVLLCSDGLSNYCTDDVLLDIVQKDVSPTEITEKLIAYANDAGGRDNITAVLIQQDR